MYGVISEGPTRTLDTIASALDVADDDVPKRELAAYLAAFRCAIEGSRPLRRDDDRCRGCGATRASIEGHGAHRLLIPRVVAALSCPQACTCVPEHTSWYDHQRFVHVLTDQEDAAWMRGDNTGRLVYAIGWAMILLFAGWECVDV